MRRLVLPVGGALALIAVGVTLFLVTRQASPEQVAERYLRAHYINDAATIYDLASATDRRYRTREEYLSANQPYEGDALRIVQAMARYLTFSSAQPRDPADAEVVIVGVVGQLPDPATAEMGDIVSGPDPVEARLDRLHRLAKDGVLPMLHFDEAVELRREEQGWRVFLDWAVAYTVDFSAQVMDGLPFRFSVEPESIVLRPGETGSVVFHAKNLSDRTITAKAGHVFDPPIAQIHTQTLQCFCFFQDTFEPGEEKELPLVFRLDWQIPADFTAIAIRYEYYPIDSFVDRREVEPAS